jgi:hypothetical protein
MWDNVVIMKTKKITINKDGSKRKIGSGRKKGSNSFVKVSFGQLKDYIGERTPIMVSRVWLESLGFLVDQESSISIKAEEIKTEEKIAFSITDFEEGQ